MATSDAIREDTIIVGAGPIGIACAISAKRRGIDPLLVDAGAIVNSIVHYPVAMRFFTTPELLEIGGHPFPCGGEKPTREEALKYYRGVVRTEGIRVRPYCRLVGAARDVVTGAGPIRGTFQDDSGEIEMRCERLVLATGYFDQPNALGVPGEDLPHVSHYYDEGHGNFERDVVVVGGGNSASEAALDLFRAGARVTIVHRHAEIKPSVKYWVRPDLQNRIAAGEIAARFEAEVVRIAKKSVVVKSAASGGGDETLAADRVYLLTGFRPDLELFRRIGIELQGERLVPVLDRNTFESNVPGVYLVGSITNGTKVSDIFIENGRFDGEKVFGR